jgi:uncharacterized protein
VLQPTSAIRPSLAAPHQRYVRDFLETFTPLVLAGEKQRLNYRWGDKNRDCAGLVRYLYWEALQAHTPAFYRVYPDLYAIVEPPRSTDSLNRAAAKWSQNNFTVSQLIAQTKFISRAPDWQSVKTGDLLYFYSSELGIRHVMLVLRSSGRVFLVYHTGDSRAELRIRKVRDLLALPDMEWHPESANPTFRGIFRPLFLD